MCGTRPGKGRAELCRCTQGKRTAALHQACTPGAARRFALRLCRGDEGGLAGLLPEAARDKPGPLLSLGSFTELSVAADPFLTTCYRRFLPRNDRLCIRFGTGGWPHLVGICFTHSRLAPAQTARDLLTPTSMRASGRRRSAPACPVF